MTQSTKIIYCYNVGQEARGYRGSSYYSLHIDERIRKDNNNTSSSKTFEGYSFGFFHIPVMLYFVLVQSKRLDCKDNVTLCSAAPRKVQAFSPFESQLEALALTDIVMVGTEEEEKVQRKGGKHGKQRENNGRFERFFLRL